MRGSIGERRAGQGVVKPSDWVRLKKINRGVTIVMQDGLSEFYTKRQRRARETARIIRSRAYAGPLAGLLILSSSHAALAQLGSGSYEDPRNGADIIEAAADRGVITFQDIYENPDDQALNLAYARQQAAAGKLKDAAATLERLLFFNADWDSVRLFYAVTLSQLDDDQAAAAEFDILRQRPLTPEQMAVVERYDAGEDVSDVNLLNGDWSGRVWLAGRYDDNVGGVFADIVFGNRDAADYSITLAGQLRYNVPVSADGDVNAYLRGHAQMRRHDDIPDSDYNAYGGSAGLRGTHDKTRWDASLTAQTIEINGESYNTSLGFNALAGYDVASNVTLWAVARYRDENYDPIANSPNADDRNGDRLNVGAAASVKLTPKFRTNFEATYQTVSARDDDLGYDGVRLSGAALYDFTPSVYGRAHGVYRTLNYDGDSILLFPAAPREDEFLNARGALGLRPLLWLEDSSLPRSVQAIALELAVNYTDRSTNIPNSNYENTGVELRLIYDF